QAEQRVAPELVDAKPKETLFERSDQHGAQHRSGDPARSAENIDAADDDRGDDVEFEAASGLHRDIAETSDRHETGQTSKRPRHDESQENDTFHRQTDELRRLGI